MAGFVKVANYAGTTPFAEPQGVPPKRISGYLVAECVKNFEDQLAGMLRLGEA
ncbi:MAG: hypothetical protein SFV81_02045 [Pirellulaceae bacterium]|nr:hypothetical protein [Pirellulaceae bacterium]